MAGCRVTYNLQVLEDTELYQVQRPDASHAALKIARAAAPPTTHRMLAREAGILRRLDNAVNPALFESGRHGEQPYLLMSWCGGIDAMSAAAERRGMGGRAGQRGLVELCAAILDAYGHLHAQHVIHGDVHPHNVLVDVEGTGRSARSIARRAAASAFSLTPSTRALPWRSAVLPRRTS